MSTQETAALIESVNNMTATVAGKMGQIDNKLASAEQKFDSFLESADDRFMGRSFTSFKVGGSIGKFYPVFVPASHVGVATISIGRSIHLDGQWRGAMTMRFLGQSFGWGGYPAINLVDVYKIHAHSETLADISSNGFVAKYSNPITMPGIVFWLRGDCTYYISSSLFNIKGVTTFTDKVIDRAIAAFPASQGHVSVFLSGLEYVSSGVTEKWDETVVRDATLIPSLNYARGV